MIPKRRKTRSLRIGKVSIGSDFPVAIQSMCSTRTEQDRATVEQIKALEAAGCEMVRVAVPNMEAAGKLALIKSRINIPLIADIHFDYRLALVAIKEGVDKVRINPGNISPFGEAKTLERVIEVIEAVKKAGIAMRIGVNSGSLEQDMWSKYGRPSPEALVESALRWIGFFEAQDFRDFAVAVKSSDVPETVRAYELLAEQCDYPFHVGITEAGIPPYGNIKSAVGIGTLLLKGIGDTIRVSITDDPVNEIRVCKDILKSLHLYTKEPEVISCPTCGRIEIDLMKMSREIEAGLRERGKAIKVSVLGCAVNGPGEAKEAEWGIAGGRKAGVIFRRGKVVKSVSEEKLVEEFFRLVEGEGDV